MTTEPHKVYLAGGRLSPTGKLVTVLVAGLLLLSAMVLAVLFVGLVLPLIVILLIVAWALRRWRLRGAPLSEHDARHGGATMEGEYRVIERPGDKGQG